MKDEMKCVACETLQAQVDEHTKQIADMITVMRKIDNLLTQNLDELKAQGKYP